MCNLVANTTNMVTDVLCVLQTSQHKSQLILKFNPLSNVSGERTVCTYVVKLTQVYVAFQLEYKMGITKNACTCNTVHAWTTKDGSDNFEQWFLLH